MTNPAEIDKPDNCTAVVRDQRLLSICIECEHCKGSIVSNVGTGSDNEIISGYLCSNPAKTGTARKEINMNNPLTCACKHRNIWAYDTRGEISEENKKLKKDIQRLRYQLDTLETKISDRDEYIEKLQSIIKEYERENLKEEKDQPQKAIEVTNEPNPWDI